MRKLKCIIIDDDPTITDLISHFCDKHADIDYCIECNDAVDGLKLISSQEFDIVLLDYNMPHLNGEQLVTLKQDKSKVIMITSESSFAVDSYQYDDIVDYLLKPVSYDRFCDAIDKIMATPMSEISVAENEDTIMTKEGSKWIPIKISQITYIKSESNYSTIHTPEQKIMSLISLKVLEEKLPSKFIRIHRSYIVNTDHVTYYTTEEVNVSNKNLPVSGKYRSVIKDIISKY